MNLIDTYIASIPDKYQKPLETLRSQIQEILPTAEECISYGMPAFRVDGKWVAGFAAFKNHLSFFPFSGSVLDGFHEELKDFEYTKSGVHFTPEKPIPKALLEKMIQKRLEQ